MHHRGRRPAGWTWSQLASFDATPSLLYGRDDPRQYMTVAVFAARFPAAYAKLKSGKDSDGTVFRMADRAREPDRLIRQANLSAIPPGELQAAFERLIRTTVRRDDSRALVATRSDASTLSGRAAATFLQEDFRIATVDAELGPRPAQTSLDGTRSARIVTEHRLGTSVVRRVFRFAETSGWGWILMDLVDAGLGPAPKP